MVPLLEVRVVQSGCLFGVGNSSREHDDGRASSTLTMNSEYMLLRHLLKQVRPHQGCPHQGCAHQGAPASKHPRPTSGRWLLVGHCEKSSAPVYIIVCQGMLQLVGIDLSNAWPNFFVLLCLPERSSGQQCRNTQVRATTLRNAVQRSPRVA